jgi:hypothetical protein
MPQIIDRVKCLSPFNSIFVMLRDEKMATSNRASDVTKRLQTVNKTITKENENL